MHFNMVKLKPGDKVECKVKGIVIVSPYRSYDEIRTFEIVSTDIYGYYLFVPVYILIEGSIRADVYRCKQLYIDLKFLDENIAYIDENMVYQVSARLDGMTCSRCKEFCHMAAPNQFDDTMICWSCRNNRYR